MTEMTVAQHLFQTPYACMIPNMYCYSEAQLKEAGVDSSWDKNIDKALMKELRPLYLTIVKMVHFYHLGSPIHFQNPKDTVSIYTAIKEHLDNWRTISSTVLNAPDPPIDDLRLMDEFATAIYWTATQNGLNTLKKNSTPFGWKFNRGYLFDHKIKSDEVKEEKEDPGHISIADVIARFTFNKYN